MNMFAKILQLFKTKDIYGYTDIISRRQLETFRKLEANNNIKLMDVVTNAESVEKTLVICSNSVLIDYDGLVSYDSTGFYPVDWTPLGDVMSFEFEDDGPTSWSNSPIHEMIRDAGLDEC